MVRIFLTGGSGFVGRNLKESLEGEYIISAPSSKELNLLDENKVLEFFRKGNFDIVIHTATWDCTRNTKKDPNLVLCNNLRMFFNIARCNSYYNKMIYFGSGAEYNRSNWIPKMDESYFDVHVPKDDYGFSKYVMNKYALQSKNIYNLRLFGVFGKYEDWEIRFISNACCKAIYDLPITIKQNVFFDYMYIDDLLNITKWFIQHDTKEKVYNVCAGSTFDLLSLAKKVILISKKKIKIVIKNPGLGHEYSGDNSRLLNEMGCYTFKNMDVSISELYRWYLSRKKDINKELLIFDK